MSEIAEQPRPTTHSGLDHPVEGLLDNHPMKVVHAEREVGDEDDVEQTSSPSPVAIDKQGVETEDSELSGTGPINVPLRSSPTATTLELNEYEDEDEESDKQNRHGARGGGDTPVTPTRSPSHQEEEVRVDKTSFRDENEEEEEEEEEAENVNVRNESEVSGSVMTESKTGTTATSYSTVPEGWRLNRFGFLVPISNRDEENNSPSAEEKRWEQQKMKLKHRDAKREKKWLKMIGDWNTYLTRRGKKAKRRVRKGIPDSVRSRIWFVMCGADRELSSRPSYYEELKEREADRHIEVQIKKDKKRTMQNHYMFKSLDPSNPDLDAAQGHGQSTLYHVLRSYSLHNPSIGYCQGMSSPTAMFVAYMPEEHAFWMLERVLASDRYMGFGDIYRDGFPLLFEFIYIHERLMEKHVPKLKRHLDEVGLITTAYCTRWYSTIFAKFPPDLVLRLWDIFLFEGVKILFRFTMLLMKRKEKQLLKADFEEAIMTLQALDEEEWLENTDEVIKAALKIPMKKKEIIKYSKKYRETQP